MKAKKTPRWLSAARERDSSAGQDKPDWLSRALARAGALPLAQAEAAIADGRVKMNGRVVTKPFAPLPERARVQLDGKTIDVTPRTRVLMFHKPAGIVCAGHDQEKQGTVFEALQRLLSAELASYSWHGVGRLDRDTTGLYLFTNDERFVAFATSPATHLPKRYLAQVAATATDAQLEPLRRGITLDDGPARPAKALLRERGLVELTLTEGRNHQVKRMLAHVKLPVKNLHREAVGELTLDIDIAQWRELAAAEINEKLGFVPRGG
ncbi:MAG: rRNA pseudouridine synthase [Myxococcaceae bacterium]|nr:rRNA pseudouridine synthase [Myxococcaceae bacterium]